MINNNPNKPIYEIVSLNKNILTDRTSIDDIRNLVFNAEEKYDESKAIENVMDVDDDIIDENGDENNENGDENNENNENSDDDSLNVSDSGNLYNREGVEIRENLQHIRDNTYNRHNRRNRSVSSVRSNLSQRSNLSGMTNTSDLSNRSEINHDPLVLAVKQQNMKIIRKLLKNNEND